ncbi:uncharacterized protein LOC130857385 [Hippopotamus amphibius kiboko]|uniref:uncharacterized protein LOC130857385 n=1 Tax=Hippopotamus amphibius kiboko TaxID=575201 RepID=UPI0025954F4E|nr:uncharacterized protein LOC130857385 [Hippopotamus amphibius kiboko]XP_057599005.1 uncharacterized protein LOC130857385 [Hippopotamus amphibius kiboko]XP_057599006.1 uncharacterized protein LOC130857385 [Hippopotamus amphibius kiboko]
MRRVWRSCGREGTQLSQPVSSSKSPLRLLGGAVLSGPGRGAVGHLLRPSSSGGCTLGLSGLGPETASVHRGSKDTRLGVPLGGWETHGCVAADALASWLLTQRWRRKSYSFVQRASAGLNFPSALARGLCAQRAGLGRVFASGPPCCPHRRPQPQLVRQEPEGQAAGLAAQPRRAWSKPRSAGQARLAALGAEQPAFVLLVTGAACSVPSLFFPGQAGQAEAWKPWKPHRPPVPPQLFSLPSCFLRLCRPPGVLALPQLGSGLWAEQPSLPLPPPTLGPQLGQCGESQGGSGALGSPHLLLALLRCRL